MPTVPHRPAARATLMAEDEKQRLDRELIELLNELRVALPGVQVLFAFLLTVPFTQRFDDVTPFQRDVYFACLVACAIATVFLIAPSAFHRIRFRKRDKRRLIELSNAFAITGLVFLSVAMTGVVLLVSDVIFSVAVSVVVTAVVGGAFLVLWFLLPLQRHAADQDESA